MFNRKTKEYPIGQQPLGSVAFMPGGVFDMAVASVFIGILGLALPLALLRVFDHVIIPERDDGVLIWLILGIGSALMLEVLLRVGRSYVGGWMGARFEHMASCNALDRLLHANITDFEKLGAGAYMERLNALGALRKFYAGPAANAIFDFPFVVFYLGVIAYLAGLLVLVPVVLIVLFVAATWIRGRLEKALEGRMLADDRRLGFIIEVLGGIHTVKGFGMEEQMQRRYERLRETSAEADYRLARDKESVQSLGAFFSLLVVFGVAGFGAFPVIDGTLPLGKWQRIFMVELDEKAPSKPREVLIQVMGV